MDVQTANLLEKAFGQLGVASKAALAQLSAYYWTYAIVELVLLLAALGWSLWTIPRLLSEIKAVDGKPFWPESLIFKTWTYGTAILVVFVVAAFDLPSCVGALVSPDGYVLSRLVSAVSR